MFAQRVRRLVPALLASLSVAAVVAGAARIVHAVEQLPLRDAGVAVQNSAYDGRFAFARLKYETAPGGYYYYGLPAWSHGYVSPAGGNKAEEGLMRIMHELTLLNSRVDDSVVVSLDDPELTNWPVAYMVEAGYWTLTDREAAAFRAYLQKGGFVIFDDFRPPPRGGGGWENFDRNMRQVIPDAKFVDLDPSHPIFHSFFEIDSLDILPQSYDRGRPAIRGLFENNDPHKRLIAIVNFNTDISDFWEFSATGVFPVELSNEAYKLGVNYIMYGLTH
jgi:hypothetical protein